MDGHIAVGGDFTYANGVYSPYFTVIRPGRAVFEQAQTGAATADGLGAPVRALAEGPDGYIYIGGDFKGEIGGGKILPGVCRLNTDTSEFERLGLGLAGGGVYTLAFGPDGILYAGGTFQTVAYSELPAKNVAYWNGAEWRQLGEGLGAQVRKMAFDDSGLLHIVGDFPGGYAIWNGSRFVWPSIQFGQHGAALAYANGTMWAALHFSSASWYTAGETLVRYKGSAPVRPTIRIAGPCRPRFVRNQTTHEEILFSDLKLENGEVVIIDQESGRVTSNMRDRISDVIAGSLYLWPGDNVIEALAPVAGRIELLWNDHFYSVAEAYVRQDTPRPFNPQVSGE
jgi:hypothetical protein